MSQQTEAVTHLVLDAAPAKAGAEEFARAGNRVIQSNDAMAAAMSRLAQKMDPVAAQQQALESGMGAVAATSQRAGAATDTLVSKMQALAGAGAAAMRVMASGVSVLEFTVRNFTLLSGAVNLVRGNYLGLAVDSAELSEQQRGLEKSTRALTRAMQALGVGISVASYVNYVDTMRGLEARIGLVTKGTNEYMTANRAAFTIAQDMRQPLETVSTLYTRIATALGPLGVRQSETLNLTQTISQAMRIGGGAAQAQADALMQLGQAFGANRLSGQELNSVLEQAPRLARAIADGMGIQVGALKGVAEQGLITAGVLKDALMSQAAVLAAEYEKLPITVSGAMTRLQNTIMVAASEMDRSANLSITISGIADMLSEKLGDPKFMDRAAYAMSMVGRAAQSLANALVFLVDHIDAVVIGFVILSGGKGLLLAIGAISNFTLATRALTAGLAALRLSASAAQVSIAGLGVMAAMSAPIAAFTALLTAAGVAYLALADHATASSAAVDAANRSIDATRSTIADATAGVDALAAAYLRADEAARQLERGRLQVAISADQAALQAEADKIVEALRTTIGASRARIERGLPDMNRDDVDAVVSSLRSFLRESDRSGPAFVALYTQLRAIADGAGDAGAPMEGLLNQIIPIVEAAQAAQERLDLSMVRLRILGNVMSGTASATAGLTEEQIRLADGVQMVDDAMANLTALVGDQLAGAIRQWNDLMTEGARLTESYLTGWERWEKKQQQLNALLAVGAISAGTYAQAWADANPVLLMQSFAIDAINSSIEEANAKILSEGDAFARALAGDLKAALSTSQADLSAFMSATTAETRRQAEEIERLSRDLSRDISASLYDGLTGNGDAIISFFRSIFRRIAIAALEAQIVMPIVTGIVGGAPGLFGIGGAAVNGAAGAAGAAGASAMSAGGIGALGAGVMSSLKGGVYGLKSTLFGQAGIRGTATSGWFGSGGTLLGSQGLATGVSGALAGAGIGALSGTLLGALGIGKGNTTGATIGGAIGGAAGSLIPGVGTVVGSILGGALGSLFGASPSDKEGNAIVNLEAGRYNVGGMTGAKYSQENRDAARGLADQVLALQNAIQTSLGGRVTGQIAVGAGSRDGLFATAMNSTARRTFASTDEGAQQLLSYVMQQMTMGIRDQLAPEISAALGRVDFSSIELAAQDIDFIGGFRDTLAALRGDFGLVDQVTQEAAASVQAQVDAVREFRATTARLFPEAVGEADAALRLYVEGLVGVRDAVPAATEMENALRALEAQFRAYVPLLEEVGYTAEAAGAAMEAGLAKARAGLRDDFVTGLDREFNDLTGRGWVNQIGDLVQARLVGLRDAAALGVDAALIERNFQAGLGSVLAGADLGTEQMAEVIALFGQVPGVADTVAAAMQGLLTGLGGDAARLAADLDERLAVLAGRGTQDAAIRALERRQVAEFEAAAAAGYGTEMLGRLVKVLGGEMAAAVEDFMSDVQRRSDDLQQRLLRARAADPLASDAQRTVLEGRIREIQRARELTDAANDNERSLIRLTHAQEDLNVANQALADSATAASKAADEAAAAMERIRGMGGSIRQWLDQQQSGGLEGYLSPAEQLANAQNAFDREYALAANDNEAALRGITGYAQRLLEAQMRWSGSGGDSQALVAEVLGLLEGLPAVQSFDEQQLAILRQIAANTADLPAGLAIRIEEEVIRTVSVIQGAAGLTDEQRALALLTTEEVHRTIGIIVDSATLTDSQKNIALLTSQSVLKTIELVVGTAGLTTDQRQMALLVTDTVGKTIRIVAEDAGLTPAQQSLALLTSQNVLRVIQISAGGNLTAEQIDLALLASGSVQRTVNLSLQDQGLTPQQRELLLGQASTYARTIALTVDAAGMSGPARDLLLGASGAFARVVELSAAGTGLNPQEQALLLGASGRIGKIVELAATQPQGLTSDQKALLDAEAGTVQRTIAQALTGSALTADQRLALEAVSGQVQRVIDQRVVVNGTLLQPETLSASFALALAGIEFEGMALVVRYMAAVAWNTARMVGNTGQGLLIADDPSMAGDQTIFEGRAPAQLNIGGGQGAYGYETWQAVQGVGAILAGTVAMLLDKVRHNTAATAAALGGVPAYAVGTDYHPGGPALVHAGEVLLPNAPRGMQVIPAREVDSWALPPGAGGARPGRGGDDDVAWREVLNELRDLKRFQLQIAQAAASQQRMESREQVAATNRVVSAITTSARGETAA